MTLLSIVAWAIYFVSVYYFQLLLTQLSSYNFTVSYKSFLGMTGIIYITCVNMGYIWLIGGTVIS